jgi:tyrosine-protein phosphatase YwqE
LLNNIFKKKAILSSIATDIHSHLIPSIDDGSQSIETSLELIKDLQKAGYKRLITTPHNLHPKFGNNCDAISCGLVKLQDACVKADLDIEITASCEYYYGLKFLEHIRNDNLLHINKFVLFEFSYQHEPNNLEETIYELKSRGYKPLLAHPERYIYWHNKLERYEYLKNLGVYFQLNLNSLIGYYSAPVQKVAKHLSQKGFVDFIGSDTHHHTHTNSLLKVFKDKNYNELFKTNTILNDSLVF